MTDSTATTIACTKSSPPLPIAVNPLTVGYELTWHKIISPLWQDNIVTQQPKTTTHPETQATGDLDYIYFIYFTFRSKASHSLVESSATVPPITTFVVCPTLPSVFDTSRSNVDSKSAIKSASKWIFIYINQTRYSYTMSQ